MVLYHFLAKSFTISASIMYFWHYNERWQFKENREPEVFVLLFYSLFFKMPSAQEMKAYLPVKDGGYI